VIKLGIWVFAIQEKKKRKKEYRYRRAGRIFNFLVRNGGAKAVEEHFLLQIFGQIFCSH